jgi:hypothetical protein
MLVTSARISPQKPGGQHHAARSSMDRSSKGTCPGCQPPLGRARAVITQEDSGDGSGVAGVLHAFEFE